MGGHSRVMIIGAVSIMLCGVLGSRALGGASAVRCEIVFDAQELVFGENPPITLRLENANAFDVWVPAPEAGVVVYEIELYSDSQDRAGIIRAPDHPSVIGIPYFRLTPGATIECKHLLLPQFDHTRLDSPIGGYSVAPRPVLKPRLSEEPRPASNLPSWDVGSATFRIRPPDDHEQAALDMLWRGLREIEDSGRIQKYAAIQRQHVELYDSFLKEYGDTPYADEVRNELVYDLFTLLANKEGQPNWREAHWPLLEESVQDLLRRGEPYCGVCVAWDMNRGGNHLVEMAARKGRDDLLRALVSAIDQRNPADAEGAAYRRILVEAATGSLDKARELAASFEGEYPDSDYSRKVKSMLESFARRRGTLEFEADRNE